MIRLTRTVKSVLIAALMLSVSAPAFADGLRAAATEAAKNEQLTSSPRGSANKAMVLGGAGLFAVGMAVGVSAFINNKNGEFSEFGEADSSNKKLGAAGLSAAFAGGMMMFLGSRARHAPVMAVAPGGGVTVTKQVSW
jgi:hypothetical protein